MERYESLGPVGEGSYGTVLKCRHRDSGRLVAIKKFIDSDDDKTVKKIALREIKLLRQLRHDNLVNLLEVWKRRRRWYLVFEFVDRTLLDELEQNSNGLDLNTCRRYLFQILRATNFCHQQNVIHRDIKPENILISQEGVVKLCDFGFARIIASPSEGAVYTDYVATRWYRAPELLVGDIKYGKPVDVWALGCLLIEMLTGQPLFPGDSDLDQIYHIVRCFGNLTAHHQELFYRNPIFSGVKLPECSKTVPLQQRFSTIPPNALDLAQKCLAMDPKRRAQCSDLLEHLLFTQDSFNTRFLDELDTKIQKDHRENYTLPKIPQTALQEKDKGDVKNCRSKNKKQSEEAEEKVIKEKMDKTKGKQPSKLTKSVVNTTESFMSKQPKTFANKGICQPEQFSMKSEKPTGSELKESELLKSTKICSSDSADVTTKAVNLKKKSSVAAKPVYDQDMSPDQRKDDAHNAKDMDYTNPDSEKTMMLIRESSKSEISNEFVRNFSNLSIKVSKLSKIAISDAKSLNSSPKPILESDTSVAPTYPLLSFNDRTASAMLDVTKSGKINLASITDIVEDECPKIPRKPQILSNSGQHGHNNTSFSPSRTVVDVSKQLFKTVSEASAAHNPSAPPRVIPHSKVPKTTCAAKTSSKEKEPTEDQHVRNYHRHLKLNPMTQTPTTPCPSSRVLDWDPESSEPYLLCSQSNMIATEERFTSTFVPDENLSVGKGLTVSAKDNQDYLASSVSISSTSNDLKAPESLANDKKNISSSLKSLNFSHHYHNPTTAQSLNDHIRSAVNPKTQRITIPPDAKKRSNKVEGNGTNTSTDLTSVMSVDHKALTRSPILHEKDTTDIDEFDYSILRSCTPSPPPGPATNRLHLPPSSRTLTPSVFVSSTFSPAANDHLLQGGGFHTGTSSLRSLDKPRPYGGIQGRQDQQFGLNHATRSFILQASEHSFTSERSKNSVHFPDVRSSMLAELSGKDAKQNKGTTREQRTEKTPVSSSPSSEGQYGQNFNTNTPKQSK
ncbi:cyclin-dependent kinase-like 5 isoform X1 [Fundulus heteroclitus]|uniref:cyclin-dependent kinase-like 5 isoform X1 n=1 Tax=Fundulus heteroclitus TaxID=8078 RepID=UPI00165A9446|nr:cyclin-dependent kinase-like 5 isoform X1 [Fundulus heteroclitus]XP_036002638.1 cyclin-dependent kinase-like 5 isoform X1 [Fundulus heteroclitus]XP_036002639.1 cyclin-dependent kinase-like 5 isoform X1 [Fundulus heteroclitus]XP_036002640.1 cyclin-dependent kinase-like 5 isoform X1 [Fundulus heteroclitus]